MSMISSAFAFGITLDKYGKYTEQHLSLIARKTALDLLAALSRKSPVLTGRFRANWQIAIGEPNDNEVQWEGGGGAAAKVKAISDGISNLAVYPAKGYLPIIYIFNNMPYGPGLDAGRSKNAPDGIVQPAISEVQLVL